MAGECADTRSFGYSGYLFAAGVTAGNAQNSSSSAASLYTRRVSSEVAFEKHKFFAEGQHFSAEALQQR